jgi:hypothetical protein
VNDLIEFLLARLGEDEEMASSAAGLGASRRHWTREYVSCIVDTTDGGLIVYGEGTPTSAQADHIALHDPDRALAEIDAKRRIIDLIVLNTDGKPLYRDSAVELWEDALKLLALPYTDHPSFREDWRP